MSIGPKVHVETVCIEINNPNWVYQTQKDEYI